MIRYLVRRADNCSSRLGWASVMSTGSLSLSRPIVTGNASPSGAASARDNPIVSPPGDTRTPAHAPVTYPRGPADSAPCSVLDLAFNHWRRSGSAACLRRRLDLLLVVAHPGQRVGVPDVGDGHVRTVRSVVPGRLTPAGDVHAILLAEQRDEDLRLLLAEAGQRTDSAQQ